MVFQCPCFFWERIIRSHIITKSNTNERHIEWWSVTQVSEIQVLAKCDQQQQGGAQQTLEDRSSYFCTFSEVEILETPWKPPSLMPQPMSWRSGTWLLLHNQGWAMASEAHNTKNIQWKNLCPYRERNLNVGVWTEDNCHIDNHTHSKDLELRMLFQAGQQQRPVKNTQKQLSYINWNVICHSVWFVGCQHARYGKMDAFQMKSPIQHAKRTLTKQWHSSALLNSCAYILHRKKIGTSRRGALNFEQHLKCFICNYSFSTQ